MRGTARITPLGGFRGIASLIEVGVGESVDCRLSRLGRGDDRVDQVDGRERTVGEGGDGFGGGEVGEV